MAISIEGGCDKCGLFTHNDIEVYEANKGKLICRSCFEKYYSGELIRDAKLSKLLKKNIWSKIKDFFLN
jgi:hypothetical protein